jgi:hypothetical protein
LTELAFKPYHERMNDAILGQQFGAAAAIVYLIQLLKYTPWASWYSAHSTAINRTTSYLLGIIASTGILWAMNGNIMAGGTLTITFPPLVHIIDVVLHGFGQVAINEVVYKAVKNGPSALQLPPPAPLPAAQAQVVWPPAANPAAKP